MDLMCARRELMRSLCAWREVVVFTSNVLSWQEDWHPLLLASVVSLKFFILWLWDPTLISCVAVVLLNVVLADFLGPLLIPHVFKTDEWTEEKEERYEMACAKLVSLHNVLLQMIESYSRTKSSRPVMHFSLTVATLLVVAWMGNVLNNLFLFYLLSILIIFLPGLQARGYVARGVGLLMDKVESNMKSNKKMD